MEVLITISLLLTIFFVFKAKKYSNRLPPGSMGLPVIGQTPDFLKALKADKVEVWFHERIAKYGPIWKVGLFGNPTIVLHGPSANKFIYSCGQNMLTNTQPPSTSRIFGKKSILELSGHDHKQVRAALVSFLKLDVLKQYVVKLDEEIQHHIQMKWHGRTEVKLNPLTLLAFDFMLNFETFVSINPLTIKVG
ncbi:taxane 10-beta-hydroxylase [Artemisia annua]|uniref:Taxane 10-beta-hydroxylase n=1 Tax=Artemisia annua TaxID=35608 RepID=A0A2U1LZ58_ARTAN|nr:taxane 10-beta-hydroxylase [Artemisia annua]